MSTRLGFSRTAMIAVWLAGAGFLGMSLWDNSPDFMALTLPLLVTGFGLGLVIAPLNTAVLDEVGEGERATVSSLLTVVRLIGALVGVALLTTRGLGGFYAEAGLIPLDEPRYADLVRGLEVGAFGDTFLATAVVCFACVLPALFLERRGYAPAVLAVVAGGVALAVRALGAANGIDVPVWLWLYVVTGAATLFLVTATGKVGALDRLHDERRS